VSSEGRVRGGWFWLGIAQWFGSGRLPKAPGTFGSLAALPLVYALGHSGLIVYWALSLSILGLGIVASDKASQILGEKDPQSVVIDEVVGILLAFGFVLDAPIWAQVAAFGLFRLFDIRKPGPIYRVQFLKPNGLGIMADDVLAGLLAGTLAKALVLGVEALS
jgi:phosphatidylglycerophosphatase A